MSLERGFQWQFDELSFKGYSIAGQTTSLVFNNPKICFDIAQGLPFNLSSKLYCLTHLHADHGSGLNYLLSQRSLFSLPEVSLLLPETALDRVEKILKLWQEIEGFQYKYKLIGVNAKTEYSFSAKYKIRSFPTTHRLDSFGYIVYEQRKKLNPEFQNLGRQELLDKKSRGENIEITVEEPLVAFTGDTQIEFLESHPDVLKAKILFMECTYIDEKKSIAAAREWGHIHLDEIIPHLHRFENEHVSLIHLSSRYPTDYANQVLDQKIPAKDRDKFSWFPRPERS